MKKAKSEKINIAVSKKTMGIVVAVIVVIAFVFVALPMFGINLFAPKFGSVEEVGRAVTNISSDVKDVMGILEDIEAAFR